MTDHARMCDRGLYRAALADPPRARWIDHDPTGRASVTWGIGDAAWAALERAREPGESVAPVILRVVCAYMRESEQEGCGA